jgi:hypothetical protein
MMKRQANYSFAFLFLLCLIATMAIGYSSKAQVLKLTNDTFWNTKDGQPIFSQGGGIFKFADPTTGATKFYWYGVHYQQADKYRNDPSVTQKGSSFESVTCYSSTDLINWTSEGDVLTKTAILKGDARISWLGRMGVAYIKELKKYSLFIQHVGGVLVAISDSPTGGFTWYRNVDMKSMTGASGTGDQTVFTDEDTGKSYLIYSSQNGRNRGFVSEIGVKDGMVTLLDCTEVYRGAGREGNCMFKYKGKYYLCASDLYGWDASHAYYLVADNIKGPYVPTNEMLVMNGVTDDYAHITQTGFFYTVKGSKQETVIYCGDRWAAFAGNGLGYNQWCPLSFDGKTPYFNSLSAWNLNALTGEWSVAKDNNYAMNPSFEADRKRIPSPVKPVQTQLTGWVSTVISGNQISNDPGSPALNYDNNESDRKIVIGEKSLNISDNVDFKRKVSQIISSSPHVKLADGDYTFTAKVKNSAGFTKLELYAKSNNKTFNFSIKDENLIWKIMTINNIHVKGGKVEIGFQAEGIANSFCIVDDISFINSK